MNFKQALATVAAVFMPLAAAKACQTCGTNPPIISGPTASATANADLTITEGALSPKAEATIAPGAIDARSSVQIDAGKREASSAFANSGIPTNLCDVKKGAAISLLGVANLSFSGYKTDKELSQYESCFALIYEGPQIEALTGNTFTAQAHAAANHPGFKKALEATVFDEKAGGDTQTLSRSERLLRATTGGTTYVKGKMTIN